MNAQTESLGATEQVEFPVPLICPNCKEDALSHESDGTAHCTSCNTHYSRENGFLDLIIGERFEDDSDCECLCYEENSNDYTARNYWVPLFSSLQQPKDRPLRILAVGCGTGVEVDILNEQGFECVGIDCGNRTQVWPNRKFKHNFLLANGMKLPFPDEYFDVVFTGCVFPHVGVVGDSFVTKDDYLEDRVMLASEMSRVLTKGGNIAVSSPNRLFPFDLFHGREPGNYTPRFNRPGERFLLSANDYREMFVNAGCTTAVPQKTEGYWGFVRAKHSFKGSILTLPIRFMFWLSSRETFKFLRSTPFSPWLVMLAKK
ncbi:class I SAM-dependent methyltransferase [Glaciecola sp. 1036]|uniref:class I SAM-dependent methyltransferase n=1 Tax=Alteromonadaceae TaxID=72275 RepID=UPI003D001211